MAYARRLPQHRDPTTLPSARKYPLRRFSPSGNHTNGHKDVTDITDIRRVLVPLHPNLRRLPSRLYLAQSADIEKEDNHMARNATHVGTKRKRVASRDTTNENTSHSTRTRTRSKRLRSDPPSTRHTEDAMASEEEEKEEDSERDSDDELVEPSEMDVDTATAGEPSSSSSKEQDSGEDEKSLSDTSDEDNSNDHLLHLAQPKQLFRLRKDDLVHLYDAAGLPDDAKTMTKSEIVSAIIAARDDIASLPPSSPPARADECSSEPYSSDDGNVAGDEETDAGMLDKRTPSGHVGLYRRATMGDVKHVTRPSKDRTFSMGYPLPLDVQRKSSGKLGTDIVPKQKLNGRSSPTTSINTTTFSPLATRLRSRKHSVTSHTSASPPPVKVSKGKGKGKQVGFDDLAPKTSSSRGKVNGRGRERDKKDITATNAESSSNLEQLATQLSTRRLRSKDKETVEEGSCSKKSTRKTPVHNGQVEVAEDEEVAYSGSGEAGEEDVEGGGDTVTDGSEEEVDELSSDKSDVDEDVAEEDEVDELVSSASTSPVSTPPPTFKGRRTPVRTRLRPRARPVPPPSDGDDEAEDADEEVEEVEMDEEQLIEENEDEDEEVIEENAEEEDDEETIAVEPRKLRNGKIVGEEDVDMHEEVDDEGEDERAIAEAEEEVDQELEEPEGDAMDAADIDAEGETEEEAAEGDNDVDLTIATAKTLVRLRRHDLVRLCESRDLEPVGTKPQLAEALLQWRDRQANDFSSPSSSGTVRPSSHSKRRRRRGKSSDSSIPVLLRSNHTHMDEPITPVPPEQQEEKDRLEKEPEPELELDLEILGLEDREIPPEKLQKLEKIGSGGFKDVFIGKFKGRKIAISEFRGQLSSMDIKELKLLGGFDHPNIVRFLGVSIPENTRETPVMIVSELCSNGDLFDYVRNVSPPSLHKILVMMLDIARGLEYLHLRKPSVIHRDCKSSNILITAKGTAKIADFGLAKVKQSTRSMVRSLVGTVNWQAPELWHAHPKYNHKVDVFSCAMVYWEMLQWHLPNKKFPWEGMNEHAIYEIVGSKRQRPSVSGLRKQWCPEIVDLIERMWAQDHQDRPTMSEVVDTLEDMVAHR